MKLFEHLLQSERIVFKPIMQQTSYSIVEIERMIQNTIENLTKGVKKPIFTSEIIDNMASIIMSELRSKYDVHLAFNSFDVTHEPNIAGEMHLKMEFKIINIAEEYKIVVNMR